MYDLCASMPCVSVNRLIFRILYVATMCVTEPITFRHYFYVATCLSISVCQFVISPMHTWSVVYDSRRNNINGTTMNSFIHSIAQLTQKLIDSPTLHNCIQIAH